MRVPLRHRRRVRPPFVHRVDESLALAAVAAAAAAAVARTHTHTFVRLLFFCVVFSRWPYVAFQTGFPDDTDDDDHDHQPPYVIHMHERHASIETII